MTALLMLSSCSKSNPNSDQSTVAPFVESFPIENTKLTHCRFQTATATYSVNSAITPNPIICDEGVARAVQLISTAPLPQGLMFSTDTLSLVGTPTAKASSAAFNFYIANEAGYVILPITLSVQ